MNSRPELRLDWCSREAAKYACEHWHYSRSMPASKNVYLGVWESGAFIGVIIFGLGAGGASDGRRYGLARNFEMAELERIALREHVTPVSRLIAISLRLLKQHCPGLRLICSYADPAEQHHGGIYQASGWVYTGRTLSDWKAIFPDGRVVHSRVAGRHKQHAKVQTVDISGARIVPTVGKHRYLMALDEEMRARIAPLAKPYPKRQKDQAPGNQLGLGGETPTLALQHS